MPNHPVRIPSYLGVCLLAIFTFALTACDKGVIFEKTLEIPGASWSYDNKLSFEFEVSDTTKTHEVQMAVKHAGDFGFQNCYVQITTRFPNGEEKKQPVSLELAGQSGVWIGECSGNTCTLEIPLQAKARFKAIGKHSITVEQFMRVNPLPGIEAISLKVKQLE